MKSDWDTVQGKQAYSWIIVIVMQGCAKNKEKELEKQWLLIKFLMKTSTFKGYIQRL